MNGNAGVGSSVGDDGQETSLAFEGHEPRSCGEHRTVGRHRAWCHDDGEWCYPESPCPGCQQPVGVCVICASNVYHDGGHFPEAADHNHAGYNCVAPKPQVVGNHIGDPYCPVCPPRSSAVSVSAQAPTPALPASMLRPDDGTWYDKDDPDDQPSGSGVVPDKPALAPAEVKALRALWQSWANGEDLLIDDYHALPSWLMLEGPNA